jgi:phosphatidate cytidylyltransferase
MMKGRNLINAIGIPLWLFLIWKGGLSYSIFILISSVIALGEFYRMMEKKGAQPLRWMGMASTVFIADYYYVQPVITSHELLGGVILIIILTCIWELFSKKENPAQNISTTLAGILFISVLLGTAIDIRQFDHVMSTQLTLALILSVWTCDSAAFILGTLFGKKKIFPSVSPKKSWVGSISGVIAAFGVMLTFHYQGWLGDYFSLIDAMIFGCISGIFGQLGDFTESMLKRDAGVKDSGSLLAGHGGVLDRFDSLIFAMPLSYLYIHFLMHI